MSFRSEFREGFRFGRGLIDEYSNAMKRSIDPSDSEGSTDSGSESVENYLDRITPFGMAGFYLEAVTNPKSLTINLHYPR